MAKSKVVVITINYESAESVLAFLADIERAEGFSEIEVIIADNSPEEEPLSSMRQAVSKNTNVGLIDPPSNRGYFGAARFAFDHYLEQGNVLPDWLIVCNHDVRIEDKEFFSKLLRQDPRTTGVIAPRIRALPGRVDQNPFMRKRPGALRWANLRFVSSNYWVAAIWDRLSSRNSEFRSWLAEGQRGSLPDRNEKRESIYAAHGSFFIFSRRYFEAGGFLDGNLFLYGEEISVAEICRSLGLPLVYEPSLCVFHKEHQSTGKVLSRFTYECQKTAMQYVRRRYLSGSLKPVGSCHPNLS